MHHHKRQRLQMPLAFVFRELRFTTIEKLEKQTIKSGDHTHLAAVAGQKDQQFRDDLIETCQTREVLNRIIGTIVEVAS